MNLTPLKIKIAEKMPHQVGLDGDRFYWRVMSLEDAASNSWIRSTEWPSIVDDMIRAMPVEKRQKFLTELEKEDPADLLLRLVVQHWWVKASVYFRVMEGSKP